MPDVIVLLPRDDVAGMLREVSQVPVEPLALAFLRGRGEAVEDPPGDRGLEGRGFGAVGLRGGQHGRYPPRQDPPPWIPVPERDGPLFLILEPRRRVREHGLEPGPLPSEEAGDEAHAAVAGRAELLAAQSNLLAFGQFAHRDALTHVLEQDDPGRRLHFRLRSPADEVPVKRQVEQDLAFLAHGGGPEQSRGEEQRDPADFVNFHVGAPFAPYGIYKVTSLSSFFGEK